VKEELQRIYDSVPEDKSRSRLEPYRELILRWRRQGRTYRRIRELLAEKCGVKVADMTLHEFVQRRSRPRKVQPEADIGQTVTADPEPSVGKKRLTPEEKAAQVEFIRALNKPKLEEQPAKPRWNFDADKPRTIHKP